MKTGFKSCWCVARLKPNGFKIAEINLARQGFNTFMPLHKITKRKGSNFFTEYKPLFPGYMFVSVTSNSNNHWRKINSTRGISKIISLDGQPAKIPIDLINALKEKYKISKRGELKEEFNAGQSFKFLSGPFVDLIGKIEHIEEQNRILVVLDFLGQKTKVLVNF